MELEKFEEEFGMKQESTEGLEYSVDMWGVSIFEQDKEN